MPTWINLLPGKKLIVSANNPRINKDLKQLPKDSNVEIVQVFREQLALFSEDPTFPTLENHQLEGKYQQYYSIDITTDYRALYKIIIRESTIIAIFSRLGTHRQLYQNSPTILDKDL